MKISKYLGVALVLMVLSITLIGCDSPEKQNLEKIKIGIMTPTTGELAFLGQNIVRSAQLAVKELGYEDKIELVIEDTGYLGGGKGVVSAYRKLVDVDQVKVIVDGMSSDGTMTVAPLIDADKVVMITPLTGGENVDNAAEYLFRNGPSDILAGVKPANDIYDKFNISKIALYTDNAEYTLDISKHFKNAFKGEIVVDEIIIADKKDYKAELLKMEGKDIDAIVINTASGISAAYIIKELYELENKKPIFTNFIAYGENTLTITGKGMEEVYVYDPEFDQNSSITKSFFERYKESYGSAPAIPFHTTGTYDAVKMIMEAVQDSGYDGIAIHDYLLQRIKNWQGMNGVMSFDEEGNRQSGFVLKQVKEGVLIAVN